MKEVIEEQIDQLSKYPKLFDEIISKFNGLENRIAQIRKNSDNLKELKNSSKQLDDIKSTQETLVSEIKNLKVLCTKNKSQFSDFKSNEFKNIETEFDKFLVSSEKVRLLLEQLVDKIERQEDKLTKFESTEEKLTYVEQKIKTLASSNNDLVARLSQVESKTDSKIEKLGNNLTKDIDSNRRHFDLLKNKLVHFENVSFGLVGDLDGLKQDVEQKGNTVLALNKHIENLKIFVFHLEGKIINMKILYGIFIIITLLLMLLMLYGLATN